MEVDVAAEAAGAGDGGADDDGELTIDDLVQVGSTLLVDLDESTLDMLNVTRQVNTAYDEIRISDSFDQAVGVPEPASLALLGLGGLLLGRRRTWC